MDSFLSGFSHNYGSTQIGTPNYAGNTASLNGSNASTQATDVTQLQPGDTFQGEIVSVNGEDVQIQLANGQYMAAKLERDVQVALGQVLSLQVQSNKDNKIVLKPVYDRSSQMIRVGEAALRAAHMAVNDKNLALVSTLLENGMSIDKKTLMTFNRLALQNPQASLTEIIKLHKLQLPLTDSNVSQLQNYQNLEHKLLDGIKEASDEIIRLYDTLIANQDSQTITGQSALDNGAKFMEQVLTLLFGESKSNGENAGIKGSNSLAYMDAATKADPNEMDHTINGNKPLIQANEEHNTNQTSLRNNAEQTNSKQVQIEQTLIKQDPILSNQKQESSSLHNSTQETKTTQQDMINTIVNQLRGEKIQTLPNRVIALIKDGTLDLKGVKQLLMDTELGRQLTTGQKTKIFQSGPFHSIVRDGLQKQWTLTPQDLTQEGKVEEFYQKLMKESGQLSRMMNEAMQSSGQTHSSAQAMTNIHENVEFMNQMNQMFSYVQLPLKLNNSQAHGDLYVYTNKKNMARKDGMLTAFLHLDMDHLGALDISILLQTEKNQVTTKFYLDETSIALVEDHIEELAQRLSKKGYQCKNMILEKEEDKTVLEHIEEQVAGGSAVLSYQTFDTRA